MTNRSVPRPLGAVEKLTEVECLALLRMTSIGRIAYVDANGQQLIPVNFILLDGRVYFRTLTTGILSKLARGHDDVAFGVDHFDVSTRSGQNVTVRGSAREVEDRANISKVLSNPGVEPWAGGLRPMVIEICPVSIDGRRVFVPNTAAPALSKP